MADVNVHPVLEEATVLVQVRRAESKSSSRDQHGRIFNSGLGVVCGSLADGKQRLPREGEDCQCKDGWTGLNCNRKSMI